MILLTDILRDIVGHIQLVHHVVDEVDFLPVVNIVIIREGAIVWEPCQHVGNNVMVYLYHSVRVQPRSFNGWSDNLNPNSRQ